MNIFNHHLWCDRVLVYFRSCVCRDKRETEDIFLYFILLKRGISESGFWIASFFMKWYLMLASMFVILQ